MILEKNVCHRSRMKRRKDNIYLLHSLPQINPGMFLGNPHPPGPSIRNQVHREVTNWELHMLAQGLPPRPSRDKPVGERAAARPRFVLNSHIKGK